MAPATLSWRRMPPVAAASLIFVLAGCQGPGKNGQLRDPLEPVNRVVFEFNQAVNFLVINPVTGVYRKVAPDWVEEGVSNFFGNVSYPFVIVNDLLQFQFDRALESTGRLAINTTLGIGGLFDPATDMGLPAREQSFGVTAAKWGWEPGPYIVLPLLGPSTTSTLPDVPLRIFTNPIYYLDAGTAQSTLSGIGMVDSAAVSEQGRKQVEQAVNPYVFLREAYWQRQQAMIREALGDPDVFEDVAIPEDVPLPEEPPASSAPGDQADKQAEDEGGPADRDAPAPEASKPTGTTAKPSDNNTSVP